MATFFDKVPKETQRLYVPFVLDRRALEFALNFIHDPKRESSVLTSAILRNFRLPFQSVWVEMDVGTDGKVLPFVVTAAEMNDADDLKTHTGLGVPDWITIKTAFKADSRAFMLRSFFAGKAGSYAFILEILADESGYFSHHYPEIGERPTALNLAFNTLACFTLMLNSPKAFAPKAIAFDQLNKIRTKKGKMPLMAFTKISLTQFVKDWVKEHGKTKTLDGESSVRAHWHLMPRESRTRKWQELCWLPPSRRRKRLAGDKKAGPYKVTVQ